MIYNYGVIRLYDFPNPYDILRTKRDGDIIFITEKDSGCKYMLKKGSIEVWTMITEPTKNTNYEETKFMYEATMDDRFEIIEKAKKHILEATNINMSPDEMKVLDNFLMRCWQMGWLDKYETRDDGLYIELFAVKHGKRYKAKVCSMIEVSKTLTNGLMDGLEKLWV